MSQPLGSGLAYPLLGMPSSRLFRHDEPSVHHHACCRWSGERRIRSHTIERRCNEASISRTTCQMPHTWEVKSSTCICTPNIQWEESMYHFQPATTATNPESPCGAVRNSRLSSPTSYSCIISVPYANISRAHPHHVSSTQGPHDHHLSCVASSRTQMPCS